MCIKGNVVKTVAIAASFSLTMFLGASHVHAATYYVDSIAGNNSNTGTSTSAAWQTLAKVNKTVFNPGDTVSFLRGDTFIGNLVVGQSGTAGNPITYTAYGTGANPIINATGNLHGVDIRNGKSYININGIDISNATNEEYYLSNGLSNINISNTTVTGTTTYNNGFNLVTGTTTNITITNATSTINGSVGSDFVAQQGTFLNITINNLFASTTLNNGIEFTPSASSTNVTIVNSTINGHNAGGNAINFQGTGSNIIIASTTTTHNGNSGLYIPGSYNGVSVSNLNSFYNTNGWGAYFGGVTAGGQVTNVTVNNSDLEYNGQDGLLFAGYGMYATTTNSLSQHNLNDGMDEHGYWTNVLFDHDTSYDNGVNGLAADGDGFSIHDNTSGTFTNNISRNNKKSGIANVGFSNTIAYNNLLSNDTNGTQGLMDFFDNATATVFNNVLYSPAHVGVGYKMTATTSVTFMNNVIEGFATTTYDTSIGSFINDYNDIDSDGLATSTFGKVVFGLHTINANPQFNNPSGLDFSLASTSPLINAGTTTPYTTDFLGNPRVGAPDIGAYEYQPLATQGTASSTSVGTSTQSHGATYYFDSVNGSDTNTGTSTGSAWQHLSKLTTTTLNPGDTVYLLRGDTFNSNLVVNQSGTAGNPITYTAYGTGANPIINATGNLHGVDIRNGKSYINISNIDVSNGTNEEYFLDNGVSNINISNTTVTGTTTYNNGFNLTAGTSSNITITNATSTISGPGKGSDFVAQGGAFSNITFNNFFASTTDANGIVFTPSASSTNVSIFNSIFNGHNSVGEGINFQGTGSNITIATTTTLYNANSGICIPGSYNGVSLSNDTSSYNTNGFGAYFGGTTLATPVTNVMVNNSDFEHNGQDGEMFAGYGTYATTTNTIAQYNANDGMNDHDSWTSVVFDHDTSANNTGDGFGFHDNTSGILSNNISRNNKRSGMANVGASNTTVYNNLLSNDTNGSQGLMDFFDGATASVYNNDLYSPAQVGVAYEMQATSSVSFLNNVISGFATSVYNSSTGTFTNDYNDVYSNGLATSTYGTVTFGPNTINVNPQFNNPSALDFTLASTSPLINAGTTTPYTTDYLGNPRVGAPDIGSYEYQGTSTAS